MSNSDLSLLKPLSSSDRGQKHEFFLVAQGLRDLVGVEPTEFQTQRRYPRESRSLSISIQPLNDDFQPAGEMFWVVSNDISIKGLGMISPEPIRHRFVRIGLLNEDVSVVAEIRHNTSIGQHYPLYLVGVEFLNETDCF